MTLEGFRSFGTKQVLDFSALESGLYHVTGRNDTEPELQANGVGKSSLFEALFWVLYGKTSRNLKAGAIKNWHYDGRCQVTLAFEQYELVHLLTRTWNPNKLTLQTESEKPEEIDQVRLEELIGVAPEAFLCSLYFAQFVLSFIDLSPADRMSLYSAVMKLDAWEERSDRAHEKLHRLQTATQESGLKIAELQATLAELQAQRVDSQAKEWMLAQSHKIAEAEKDKAVRIRERTQLLKHLKDFPTKAALEKPLAKCQEADREFRHASFKLDSLKDQLKRIIAAANITTCPTCGAAWDKRHARKEVAKLEEQVAHQSQIVTKHNNNFKLLSTEAERSQAQLEEVNKVAQRIYIVENIIESCDKAIKQVRETPNPHKQAAVLNKSRTESVTKELAAARARLEEDEALLKACQFWVKGFKDIRLLLIEESLEQLNVEVNECLFQLGLQEWAVKFETEQETKSKTIRRGFTCLVSAPGVDSAPWEAWSGGESQRLRVAVSMGVSNLIASRTGLMPNVELWDEPSSWLSESGITGLLEVLRERATAQRKIILLADHRALEFGGFAGTINVIKSSAGSQLEWNQ